MSERRGGQSDSIAGPISNETLAGYISLGCQLAAQTARKDFDNLLSVTDCTVAHIEQATVSSMTRMQMAFRGVIMSRGVDPDAGRWREILSAMEASYRETMETLLKTSGRRGGGTLQ